MLVLSRQAGHALLLSGGIRVVVLECSRRGVRIGIEAPPSIGIMREEILNRAEAVGPESAAPAAADPDEPRNPPS